MARHLNLILPEPCSESWEAMQPQGQGRYCSSCQKMVTDFTGMSDAELAAALLKSAAGCGRFRTDQLHRDLALPRKPWPGLRAFFTITLPAFLLSLKASGQPVAPAIVQTQSNRAVPGELSLAPATQPVQGTVTDEQGHIVPFASVSVKGTRNTVSADANGKFELRQVRLPALLQVEAFGFFSKNVEVQQGTAPDISLKRDTSRKELIVVAGGYTVSKKPRPFKSLFKPKPAPAPLPPSVSLYPNPVTAGSDLTIQGRNLEPGSYHLELYNLAGQIISTCSATCSEKSDRMTLATSGLPAGNYLVRVLNEKTGKALSGQVMIRN